MYILSMLINLNVHTKNLLIWKKHLHWHFDINFCTKIFLYFVKTSFYWSQNYFMLYYHKTDFFQNVKAWYFSLCHFFSIFTFCQITTTTTKLNTFVRNGYYPYYPLKIQEFVQKLLWLIVLTFVYLLSSSPLDGGADWQTVRPGQRCQGGL